MALLIDRTDKYITEELKPIFQTEAYKQALKKFKKEDKSDSIAIKQSKIIDFKNQFIREQCLINDDKLSVYITQNLEVGPIYAQLDIFKNDYKWAFQQEVWQHLSLPQRYTLLHWLQADLAEGPLPQINLISKYVTKPYFIAAYDHHTNQLMINPQLNGGLNLAGVLVHEMQHFKQLNNQANTTDGVEAVKEHGIELKKYLDYSEDEKKQIIDIELEKLKYHHQPEVLKYKYMMAPIYSELPKDKVFDLQTFKEYIRNEYYLKSPVEMEAFNKQKEGVDDISSHFRIPPSQGDIKVISGNSAIANYINSLDSTPVLKTLNESERRSLMNVAVQHEYYEHFVFRDDEKAEIYKNKNNKMVEEVYNEVKDHKGGLSRF